MNMTDCKHILIAFAIFIGAHQVGGQAVSEQLLDYYEQLVNDGFAAVNSYTEPQDARRYLGNYYSQTPSNYMGSYDFIVVGGGSAGAVITARLADLRPEWRILLLEAGAPGNNLTNIPGLHALSRYTDYNWAFVSEPQTGACLGMTNHRCPYPRGRGLGGSSLVNGMIYARGNRRDYDQWSARIAGGGWSYEEVLPYFKRSEHSYIPNVSGRYHGFSGPLPINEHVPTSPQTVAFLDAHRQLGVPLTDVNGARQIGAARNQLITDKGQRVTTARAYLNRRRDNLVILTGAYVTRVLTSARGIGIRRQRAEDVEFMLDGTRRYVKASKEVILSAGVFGTPFILMHSGIGPAGVLRANGIANVLDIPGVGRNLQDHTTFYGLSFTTNYTEPPKSRREYLREYLQGVGPYSIVANMEGISFHETNLTQTRGVPDVELLLVTSNSTGRLAQRTFHLTDDTYGAAWSNIDPTTAFAVYVIALRPRSIGYMTLKSGDPFDYPSIDPRFLTDEGNVDIETIYQGIQQVLRLVDTPAFRRINAAPVKYTFPACTGLTWGTRDYWYCTIRQLTMNVYHPVGTCAMRNRRDGGVVNNELRVYGMENLRIVDLSVMPHVVAGHPHAAAVMIAEKAADIIAKRFQSNILDWILNLI